MRVLTVLFLLASCFQSSQSVKVTDSGFSFTLEAVKILKMLTESAEGDDSLSTPATTVPICANPHLPEEFLKVCQQDDYEQIFTNLVKIITPLDPCEICANAACTGCL